MADAFYTTRSGLVLLEPSLEEQRANPLLESFRIGDIAAVKEQRSRFQGMSSHDLAPYIAAALRNGHTELVQFMLDIGFDSKWQFGEAKGSLLYWAVSSRYEDIVALLLQRGVDPNLGDKYGITPLIFAAGGGNLPIIRLLLKHGADVNQATKQGISPLHRAASEDHEVALVELLRAGANIESKDVAGTTALILASMGGKTNAVRALLAAGADPMAVDSRGRSSLDWARANQREEVVKVLTRK
jgi:hypothetical protein